jgi:hypothetical protein
MITVTQVGDKFVGSIDGVEVVRSVNASYVNKKVREMSSANFIPQPASAPVAQFGINERFDFTSDLVTMVAKGQTASAVITGEGGLGKSFTVTAALKAAGLKDFSEKEPGDTAAPRTTYRVVKGFSTAKGLYRVLYENRNSIIVFDDCDSILKDADALNLLKGALDSYDRRIISWNTSRIDDLPRFFQFKGGVVFISNMPQSKIDQAIRSRSMNVDLSMTTDQKIERMETLVNAPGFQPDMLMSVKRDALDLIKQKRDSAREISLRTLLMVAKIRSSGKPDWKNLATYMLVNG